MTASGFEPGLRYEHDLLREWASSHASARSWCQRPPVLRICRIPRGREGESFRSREGSNSSLRKPVPQPLSVANTTTDADPNGENLFHSVKAQAPPAHRGCGPAQAPVLAAYRNAKRPTSREAPDPRVAVPLALISQYTYSQPDWMPWLVWRTT